MIMERVLGGNRSILVEPPPDCFVDLFVGDFGSVWNSSVDVVCLRVSFFHEKKRYICNVAIINKIFKRVGPRNYTQSPQN